MGTRADFYIGRGPDAEWLGSIAWDGHPESIAPTVLAATDESVFRAALSDFFVGRDDVTLPTQGWPWPWDDSQTTDYAYAFANGTVWASCFGCRWWKATEAEPDDGDGIRQKETTFPDMKGLQKVTYGKRSGLIVISAGAIVDDEN